MNTNQFNGDKEYLYQYQDSLCLVLSTICERANQCIIEYEQIKSFFNIIESFFQKRGIFENGLIAQCKLSFLISNEKPNNFTKIIMDHIFICLKNYRDFSLFKSALFCFCDVVAIIKENFGPYVEEFNEYVENIIKSSNVELFFYFGFLLNIYSDIFKYINNIKFGETPLKFMNFILKFCTENFDFYLSDKSPKNEKSCFIELNEDLIDLIRNILKEVSEKKEMKNIFNDHIHNIINYFNFTLQKENFTPSKDYILCSISILFYMVEIDKDVTLKFLEKKTYERINLLSHESDDEKIIVINDYLEGYFTSQNFISDLIKEKII